MGASHASEFNAGDLVDDMKDPGLSMCSPATRGIWFDLLCVLHELGRSGQVTCALDQFCRACRCTPAEFVAAIAELRTTQVAETHERDGNVTVISKRAQAKLRQRVLATERIRRHRRNASETQKKRQCNSDVTNYISVTGNPDKPQKVTPANGDTQAIQDQVVRNQESSPGGECNAGVTLGGKENAYIYISSSEEGSLEEKKSSLGKRKAKPKPEDTRSKHPAILAVKSVMSRYPKKEIWDEIIRFLGDSPDTEKIQSCYLEWIKRGYNPLNLAWLFDWIVTGIPEKGGFRKERNEKAETGKAAINDAVKTRDTRTTEDLGIRAPRRL